MKKCYVNTESQKQLVLKNAREHFSKSFVEKLDKKIEPYHLPVSNEDVVDAPTQDHLKLLYLITELKLTKILRTLF